MTRLELMAWLAEQVAACDGIRAVYPLEYEYWEERSREWRLRLDQAIDAYAADVAAYCRVAA